MSNSISFTAAGLDVTSIVNGFITAERQPIDRLVTRQSAVKLQSDAVSRLRNNFDSLRNAAANIVSGGITKLSSTVSNTSAVSASLSSSAAAGSISFTVDRLARSHGIRSASAVASSTSVVTTASSLALSTTTTKLGLGSASVGVGVANGKYVVEVTQATVGAVKSGATALGGSTTINGSNNTVDVSIDGVARTLTLAAGTYSSADLAAAVQSAITATGGGATTALDGTGRLRLTTAHEGSAAIVQVTGGTALTSLGLTADATAIAGTDGSVKIGSNPATTVTSAGIGGTFAVATGTGDLTFDVGGGLRTGSATVAVVSTGDRSLAAVAAAINSANVGATASSVKVSDGNWLLQVNSKSTGVNGTVALDDAVFAGVGGLIETSTAQDARITVGSGPGAYSVSSGSNVFSEVMPGVSLTALAEAASAVTVSVGMNESATADAVNSLVTSINSVIADINLQTKYDPKTKKSSPLAGDAGIRRLAEQVRGAVTALVGDATNGLASTIGIDLQRDGTLKFNRAEFTAAMSADPSAVERLFARGGSSSNGVSFAAAADKTVAGTYGVEVTTAATRATTGDILIGGSPLGQRIGVRVGTVVATYDAAPGATANDIVVGLNAAMSSAGLKVNAEASGGGVRLTAVGYGGAGSFETNTDVLTTPAAWGNNTGTDVVGTIDGKAAVGVGQRLRLLDTDTSQARGLEVDVAEGQTGTLGPVSYSPGVAARLVNLVATATSEGGTLTSSAKTYETRSTAFNEQITRYEDRLAVKEASYRRQWTAVQNLLNNMQNQQSWLTSQINSLGGGSN
ncbi:MAG: flagellar filament capping protein FliD [Actinobacteria bacterium]|nr:flagellar filament capping protein FliD [Actinomycetota bacterium]